MTLFALPGCDSAVRDCSARSRLGRVNAGPSRDRAPMRSVSRRVGRAAAARGLPSMVSMGDSQASYRRASSVSWGSSSQNLPQLTLEARLWLAKQVTLEARLSGSPGHVSDLKPL